MLLAFFSFGLIASVVAGWVSSVSPQVGTDIPATTGVGEIPCMPYFYSIAVTSFRISLRFAPWLLKVCSFASGAALLRVVKLLMN